VPGAGPAVSAVVGKEICAKEKTLHQPYVVPVLFKTAQIFANKSSLKILLHVG